MVPVDSVGVPRDPTYSGTPRETMPTVAYGTVTLYGPPFQTVLLAGQLCNSHVKGPTTPQRKTSAVWAISLSLAATDEIDFSFFSCGYLDVSVPRVRHIHLWIQCMLVRESRDQRLFDNSPGLFAVFHALHRLLTPRHPPYALSSLATLIQRSKSAVSCDSRHRIGPPTDHLPADSPDPSNDCSLQRPAENDLPLRLRLSSENFTGHTSLCVQSRITFKMPLKSQPNCQRSSRHSHPFG